MKKLIAMILAVAMIASLATGCGSGSSSTEDSSSATESSAPAESTATEESATAEETEEATLTNDGEPVYGGNLTISFPQLGSDYTPESPDFRTYMFWYEGLTAIDWSITDSSYEAEKASEISGQLAESWTWDEEKMQLIFTLRDDVYFQTLDPEYDYYGGRQLVASDVKYTYDRLLGTGSGFDEPIQCMADWAGTFYMVDSIETDGDYTVIFNFNTDSEVTRNAFLTSSYVVNVIGPEYDTLTDEQKTDWHYACGTGPYIVSDCVEGSYLTMVRNDNYYDYDERYPENKLPYLDSVTLVLISDTASLLSGFIAGDIDLVGANNGNVFTDSEQSQIVDAKDASTYWISYRDLQTPSICLNQTIEPLTDPNVRQALQYAINLEEIAQDYYGLDEWHITGIFAAISDYCITDTDEWKNELLPTYTTYDPELAKQMLADAGYPDGFTFSVAYDASTSDEFYLLIKEYLSAVGVTLELLPQSDNSERQALVLDSTNDVCGTYELAASSLNFACNSLTSTNSGYLLGKEDTIDAMVADMLALTNVDEQTEAAKALDLYYMEQHYSLITGPQQSAATYVSSNVGGYNGEAIYGRFNARQILARLWNVNG
jgi:peptide/nickel transport system substrate-binding protein